VCERERERRDSRPEGNERFAPSVCLLRWRPARRFGFRVHLKKKQKEACENEERLKRSPEWLCNNTMAEKETTATTTTTGTDVQHRSSGKNPLSAVKIENSEEEKNKLVAKQRGRAPKGTGQGNRPQAKQKKDPMAKSPPAACTVHVPTLPTLVKSNLPRGGGGGSGGAALKRTNSAPPTLLQNKKKKSRSGPKSKSSSFIGVSQYRRTGRWEAHIWDTKNKSTPGAKGRQLHLGSFDCAEDAARAYDRAAIHFRGKNADTNFPREQYTHDPVLNALKDLSKEQFVVRLRGVAQHHKIQSQKKKERKAALLRRTRSLPAKQMSDIKRNLSSYPLPSPQSVLPSKSAPLSEDYLIQLHRRMYPANVHEDLTLYGKVSTRFPPSMEQPLVYRGRVLNGHEETYSVNLLDLDHRHTDMRQDLNLGLQSQYHPFLRKAHQTRDNDMGFLFPESLLPFPDDHFSTEIHQQIKDDGNTYRYMTPIMEDYHHHHLFDDQNNGFPKQFHGGGVSAGMSRHDDQGFPFGRSKGSQEQQMSPLMEGMGEVDTGTF